MCCGDEAEYGSSSNPEATDRSVGWNLSPQPKNQKRSAIQKSPEREDCAHQPAFLGPRKNIGSVLGSTTNNVHGTALVGSSRKSHCVAQASD